MPSQSINTKLFKQWRRNSGNKISPYYPLSLGRQNKKAPDSNVSKLVKTRKRTVSYFQFDAVNCRTELIKIMDQYISFATKQT